ncbi:hypothetical protein ACI65C_009088 [Semiaphis heraclei]
MAVVLEGCGGGDAAAAAASVADSVAFVNVSCRLLSSDRVGPWRLCHSVVISRVFSTVLSATRYCDKENALRRLKDPFQELLLQLPNRSSLLLFTRSRLAPSRYHTVSGCCFFFFVCDNTDE